MKYLYLFLLPYILLLQSCSTMKVKVQVIDRDKIRHSPAVAAEIVTTAAEQVEANLNTGFYDNMREEFNKAFREIINSDLDINDESAENLITQVEEVINKIINNTKRQYEDGLNAYYQADTGENSEEEKQRLYWKARSFFRLGDASLRDLAQQLYENFEVKLKLQETANALDGPKQKLQEELELIETRLKDDPLLSVIIHAPDKYWKGNYNKTVARNFFGRSDVAITMKSWGDYTIKGIRMDASDIASNSFKAMNFGIKLLAGTLGLTTSGQQPQVFAETEDSSKALPLINLEQQKIELEKGRQLRRMAAVGMLDAILSRTAYLQNEETVGEAVRDIKNIYDTYKPNLQEQP